MQHIFLKGVVTVLLLLLVTSLALGQASVPNLINFQGRLTDASGNPVADGSHTINYTIWDLPTGGTNLWTENTSQPTSGGLFTHQLGSTFGFSLPPSIFQNYDSLYLQIQADGQIISPRIRLTSTPYTRVSQTLETGLGTGTTIESYNAPSFGGNIDMFDEVGNYNLAFESDFDGAGGFLFVARDVGGIPGFLVDGNLVGTNSARVLMGGAVSSAIFDMSLSGDPSVILPSSAINAAEMSNEPGIASMQNGSQIVLSTNTAAPSLLEAVTVTTPAAGYVVVEGKCYVELSGGTGLNYAYVQIDTLGGASITFPEYTRAGFATSPNAGSFYFPMYLTRTYFFNTARSVTFHLEGINVGSGGAPVGESWDHILTATYYPSSYGTVETFVSSSGASQFEKVATIPSSPERERTGVSEQETRYKIDLRELELKVAKAEAEAQKAKRELMEAQLKQNQLNRVQKNEPQ